MEQIAFILTDDQIDLFCTLGWTPKVSLPTGDVDENGQPVFIEKDNVSKVQWVTNRVLDYVNGRLESATRATIEPVAKIQAEQLINTELAKISMLSKVEVQLAQEDLIK